MVSGIAITLGWRPFFSICASAYGWITRVCHTPSRASVRASCACVMPSVLLMPRKVTNTWMSAKAIAAV